MTVSHRTLVALAVWLLGGMAIAVAVLPFANESWPMWVAPTALVIFCSALVFPPLIGGWMLGRVVARHGGWLGILLAAGAVAAPAGQFNDLPQLMWPGYAALVLGLAGLVLLAIRRFRRLAGPPARKRRAPARRPRTGRTVTTR